MQSNKLWSVEKSSLFYPIDGRKASKIHHAKSKISLSLRRRK